jgi:hypothetical protein
MKLNSMAKASTLGAAQQRLCTRLLRGYSGLQINKVHEVQGALPPAWGFHPHTLYLTQVRTAISVRNGRLSAAGDGQRLVVGY